MLILASASPRRVELLKTIYSEEFKVEPTSIDESKASYDKPEDAPLVIARLKMEKALINHPLDSILTADTIVLQDGKIYGKPKSKKEATSMLIALGGRPHKVITGYVIAKDGKVVQEGTVTSTLTLAKMSKELMDAYIETSSPFDKAGGYGIQDHDYIKVESLEGSYTNVMGLPTEELRDTLKKLGI